MRILLRGPDGHFHLMQKALANSRAFLLLAADLAVAQARWKRNWSPCWRQELRIAAGAVSHAEPQASGRICVLGEAGVAHWGLPGRTSRLSPGWCLGECLHTHSGGVSRVYAARQKYFAALFKC
jgi:hypothetical protein